MDNFLNIIRQLGPARLAIMGSVLIALLMFFIFVSMRISTPDMSLLYKEVSSIDASRMAAKLEESGIIYKISDDGSSIMVAADDVGRARMLLAEAGLPNGGSMGYEIFDEQSGFGTTNFVQNVNQLRALEGELARTIAALENIRSARVHLVLPQRQLFSREERTSTASVFIDVRPGAVMSSEQILSIRSVVSSAVPQLKVSNVSVIDSSGSLLARGGEDDESMLTVKTEELRRNYEQRMTQSIEDLVGRIVGFGHVRANVSADLNFDRISTNEELYDPESQVVRSSQITEEDSTEREPPSNDVSVQNNLPGLSSDLLIDTKPVNESNRIEEVTNYEISKTIRSTVRETGEINRLSVAVLVDGNYVTAEDGTRAYTPRTQEELDKISDLVRSAIGYDEDRGDSLEVVNMRFADVEMNDAFVKDSTLFGFERSDLLDAAEIIIVAIMVILTLLLVLQPIMNRLLSIEKPIEEDIETDLLSARPMSPALEGPKDQEFKVPDVPEDDSMIDMQQVEGRVKASSIKKVEDIVDQYPTETVSVIRSWITQEQ